MPQLILIVFLVFATWLIKRDIANRPGLSSAIWIPTLWVGIIASKPISAWIGFSGSTDTLDGNPIDRIFYLSMIFSALFTLSRRAVDWNWLISRNWPLVLFYGYLFLSIASTISPFSSFKRWFKEVGNILVVLVILTETNPLPGVASGVRALRLCFSAAFNHLYSVLPRAWTSLQSPFRRNDGGRLGLRRTHLEPWYSHAV